jgi:tetratricopeptide (TPR) repeat protein
MSVDYERNRLPEVRALLPRTRQLAEASASGAHLTQLGFFEATMLLTEGKFEDALRVGSEAGDLYRRTRRHSVNVIAFAYVLAERLEAGRLWELDDYVSELVDTPYLDVLEVLLAWAYMEDGRLDLARRFIDPTGSVRDLADDWLWVIATAGCGLVAAELGDLAVAAVLRARLEPYAGRMTIGGTAAITLGVTDFTLARLSDVLGDPSAALRYSRAAIEGNRRAGAAPWLARSLEFHARLVDGDEARQAFDEALTIAEDLAMQPMLRRLASARQVVAK